MLSGKASKQQSYFSSCCCLVGQHSLQSDNGLLTAAPCSGGHRLDPGRISVALPHAGPGKRLIEFRLSVVGHLS